MTWKSYVVMSGAGLLATYLLNAPPAFTPTSSSAPAPGQTPSRGAEAPDVEEEAARLQARLRAQATYHEPSRNPFRFGASPAAAPRRVRPEPSPEILGTAALPSAPRPEAPFIVLSGMAAEIVDGATVRTAILTTAGGVLLVRAGDPVGAEYRVRAITDESVELESTADGSIRRLEFRAPPVPAGGL
jgi:hypothetical protein